MLSFLFLALVFPLWSQDLLVHFNHSGPQNFIEPYRNIERSGENFENLIIEEINQAHQTLFLAVQELSLPRIAMALAQKHKEGVDVRVIIENEYDIQFSQLTSKEISTLPEYTLGKYHEWLLMADTNHDQVVTPEEGTQSDALWILKQSGIKVINDTAGGTKGSALMHHKFLIVDDESVLTTSANFSHSDFFGDFSQPASRGNPNSMIIFNQTPELAKVFNQEFLIMWGTQGNGPRFSTKKPWRPAPLIRLGKWGAVQVGFSPLAGKQTQSKSSQGLIEWAISHAQTSVDFLLFVFSEQRIVDLMHEAHDRGVEVKGLIEPDFAWRWYSEALDMLGVSMVGANCQEEPNNAPWIPGIQTVGTPALPEGDRLHHKMAVIDDRWVIMGSHNWSDAAERQNDEFILLLDSPAIAKRFKQEISARFSKAYWGIPNWLPAKIEKQIQDCKNGGRGPKDTPAQQD